MTRNRDHNKITFGKKPFRDNHVKVYYKMLYLRLQFFIQKENLLSNPRNLVNKLPFEMYLLQLGILHD